MAGMGSRSRFRGWIGSEPASGRRHSGGKEESWTGPKTRVSFIRPMVLVADRGIICISRHIGGDTCSNGHCGTVTEVNVIWIQRLIMKRKERKQCSVPVESMLRIGKEWITYRCLVLPSSPRIIHDSLIRWKTAPAPPGDGRMRLLCG